jgi:hypothetical protein
MPFSRLRHPPKAHYPMGPKIRLKLNLDYRVSRQSSFFCEGIRLYITPGPPARL